MKTSLSLAFGLGLALAAPLVTGCAGEEAEGEGANYPEPIGYDAPGAPPPGQVAASTSTQPAQGIPAQPSPLPAPDPGADGTAQAQGDAVDDVAVGGSDGSEYADTDPSALTDFRGALDPYGTWVDDPTYGTVWEPSPSVVGSDFTPYVTAGSWTYDDSGDYVWNSDYDWGWAPFHYGRWAYLGTGWGWIPGRTYAGAWVSWREGGGYIGWAPLPPTWYWRSGYAFGLGVVPYAPYSFCGYHNVFQPHFGGGLVTGGAVVGVANGTHPYVPAHPTVGGSAAGGGRVAAHPTVGGPSPSSIGLQPKEVAHASAANNAGIAHAQAFAHPGSAQALGAHAPTVNTASGSNAFASRGASSTYASATHMSAYGRANTVVATGPRYQGVAPAPYHSPSYSTPRSSYGGSSFGGGRSYGSYPSYGTPHASSPYYSGGSHYGAPSYAGGAYRGVGAAHPSSGSSSNGSQSEPGYAAPHRSSGGGGYRGGGGFHGGGGGGHAGGGHR